MKFNDPWNIKRHIQYSTLLKIKKNIPKTTNTVPFIFPFHKDFFLFITENNKQTCVFLLSTTPQIDTHIQMDVSPFATPHHMDEHLAPHRTINIYIQNKNAFRSVQALDQAGQTLESFRPVEDLCIQTRFYLEDWKNL